MDSAVTSDLRTKESNRSITAYSSVAFVQICVAASRSNPPAKYRVAPQHQSLVVEEVVRPAHRVPQRLVTFQTAPWPGKQTEPFTEAVAHVLRTHRHHSRRRELDRQRDPIYAPTDLRHRVKLICADR